MTSRPMWMSLSLIMLLGVAPGVGLIADALSQPAVTEAPAAEAPATTTPAVETPTKEAPAKDTPEATPVDPTAGLPPLNKEKTVFLDAKQKRLLLKGEVVLNRGLLEMLICKSRTKEHEAIFAVDSDAYVIHAGLLAIGAEVGKPVQYEPMFTPATGQVIDIHLSWIDKEGKPQRYKAQQLVRSAIQRYFGFHLAKLPEGFVMPADTELKYDQVNEELIWFGPMTAAQRDALLALSKDEMYRKGIETFFKESQIRELDANWVFAGSGWYKHEDGSKSYLAEGGNLVCVANFGDALLDLSIESSAENDGLMYEPYFERLPPLETKVTIELTPRPTPKPANLVPTTPNERGPSVP
ncbi:MAG: YdjY domain-containing protein [Planctomycetaceae bacterium]